MSDEVENAQDIDRSTNDESLNGEQLVDELTRIHEEVLNEGSCYTEDASAQMGAARRVMEMLASMRPERTLERTILDVDGDTQSEEFQIDDSASSSDLDLPDTIGRFELHELLGRGGFGMVFRAHDPRLARDVALKVPTASSLLSSESRQRFERECRAVASLSHPNIVPVFEVGNEGPVNYLASELIEGTDLAKWVESDGVADAKTVAKTMIKVAEAVQHAHSRGIVHRDLKPANILIAAEKESVESDFDPESIRITDFGLAKFCDEDVSLTQTGSVLGTPAYAAPEQLESGVEESIAELSDVYSLGAVLYFLLTGKAPFTADSVLAIIQLVRNSDPVHPHKIRPTVPRDLAAICLKAMDKNPKRRYASAWDFRSDLERFLRNEPTIARPTTAIGKLGKWCCRNPVVGSLLGLVFAALIVGFSTTYYQWCVAQTNLEEVKRQKERSDALLLKTEDSIDAMLNTTADALKNIPSMTGVRKEMLEKALSIQLSILEEEESAGVALETVESLRRVARIHRELGDHLEAKFSTEAAIHLIESVEPKSPGLSLDAATLYSQLTVLEMQLGDMKAVEKAASQMQALFDELDSVDLPQNSRSFLAIAKLESLSVLGRLAEKENRLGDAEDYFDAAVLLGTELIETDPNGPHLIDGKKELISAWNSLAIIRRATGKLDSAHHAYLTSLELNKELIKGNPSDRSLNDRFSKTSHNFANLLFTQKKYDEAGVHYQKAYEILKDLSIRYPSVYQYQRRLPSALSGLALIQKKSGEFEAARETTNRSIEFLRRSERQFGSTEGIQATLALAKRALAGLDSLLEDYEAADRNFELAESSTRKLVESWPTNAKYRYELALTMGNEADSLISRKQFAAAIELLQEARLEAQKSVEMDPDRVRYRNSLNFLDGKLLESYVGEMLTEEATGMIHELISPESSAAEMLRVATAASVGVEHHLTTDEGQKFEASISSDANFVIDQVVSLLEAAVAKGLKVSEIDREQFKGISHDERFELLLNSSN